MWVSGHASVDGGTRGIESHSQTLIEIVQYAVEVVDADRGEDRAVVIPAHDGMLIVLADGAGGTSNGGAAAQAVIDAFSATDPTNPSHTLLGLDQDPRRLGHGQTTAVIARVRSDRVEGVSGNSGAWLIRGGAITDLTDRQHQKPLVGAGCRPFEFADELPEDATLLIASDGLLKYARPTNIARMTMPLRGAARSLVDLVRLPDGALQDDVAIVLVRRRSPG
jgi:serine/threonine protein phosphatase PrpC